MKGESFHLCKLQIENKVVLIAKADYVINGVYCFNITQNFSGLPWLLWDDFETIYCRNSTDLFWQLKIHNKLLWC